MPTEHIVEQGETTIGLSEQYGFYAKTIWDDPGNATLKQERKEMNVLMQGDKLVIPDKRLKEVSKPPEKKHRFRRKGVPAKFRLQIFDVEIPRANQEYQLDVDGRLLKGTTDGQGVLEENVPTNSRHGVLLIGRDNFRLEIDFGFLDPLSELAGVQQRLINLGFDCGEPTGELNASTQAALREFQRRFGQRETGEPDESTRNKLREAHDQASQFPNA